MCLARCFWILEMTEWWWPMVIFMRIIPFIWKCLFWRSVCADPDQPYFLKCQPLLFSSFFISRVVCQWSALFLEVSIACFYFFFFQAYWVSDHWLALFPEVPTVCFLSFFISGVLYEWSALFPEVFCFCLPFFKLELIHVTFKFISVRKMIWYIESIPWVRYASGNVFK